MKHTTSLMLNAIVFAGLLSVMPAGRAQTASADFGGEPDHTLSAAHESFVKGDTNKAASQIHQAAAYVKRESEKVAQVSKEGMTKAGAELDKLGNNVKAGTVKSEAELKKTFAKVDHEIADCWHRTAAESRKSGGDASRELKKAGTSLTGAAKWSGTKLKEGTQASIDALKNAGKNVGKETKASASTVNKWFEDIGDGIKDLGKKL
ncbi:MAG TPA: hypothetical protein VLU94_01740 [Candidatus Nitrosotalea sp.]|nr:hypothetical protein [Candidatus Nitrosotalea sp.]